MVAFVRLSFVWCLVWARQASPPCPARKFPHRREISGGGRAAKDIRKSRSFANSLRVRNAAFPGATWRFPGAPTPQQGERVKLIGKVGPPPAGAATPWRPLPASLRSALPRSSVNFFVCPAPSGCLSVASQQPVPTQADDRPVQGGRGRARFVPLGPGFVWFGSPVSPVRAPPGRRGAVRRGLSRAGGRSGRHMRPPPSPLARASSSRPSPLPSSAGNDGVFS